MADKQFNLQAALAALHENDWLNPENTNIDDIKTVVEFNVMETKYMQRNYWIAQFGHILASQYDISARSAARILRLNSHQTVRRAMAEYPSCEYEMLSQVQESMTRYCDEGGVKIDG